MMNVWRVAQKYAYPLTALYLGAVAVLMAVTAGTITVGTGVVALAMLAVLAGFVAAVREIHGVDARLVLALNRIDQLIEALHQAKVVVPPLVPTGEAPDEERRRA
jgi:hypothetical protein